MPLARAGGPTKGGTIVKSTSIAIFASAIVGLMGVTSASAFSAFTSSKILNLRAGPGEEFAIVGVMERDVRVEVTGCVLDYTWCFLTVDGIPGWAFARSLVVDTEEGIIHVADAADKGMVPIVGADGILVIKE
jgi:uncharacterized protein YraI